MVSSAVYRYFPSRDDLLTELLVQAYTEVGTALEAADAQRDRTDLAGRWSTLAHTLRTWSLQHPHDYALLYGSPVPGYAAPQATIEPAGRVTGVLLRLLQDAPSESAAGPVDPGLHAALAGVREFAGDLPDAVVLRGLNAWAGLIGTLTLELFGHLHRGVLDYDTFFDATVRRISPV